MLMNDGERKDGGNTSIYRIGKAAKEFYGREVQKKRMEIKSPNGWDQAEWRGCISRVVCVEQNSAVLVLRPISQ